MKPQKTSTPVKKARQTLGTALGCLSLAATAVNTLHAQPDYAPALWKQAYKNHWYTSGNGHKFVVIHDMEGYYLSTISYFQQRGTQASVHYCVNGLKDNASDSPAGEITQMVREQYYAWHALCWNTYSFGTEHEGFVSNPAWYTYEMYNASSGLQRHLLDTWNITPRDRNHVVGHNEWQNPAWVSYAGPAFGIDPTCNTHTDPGQYWNWTYFMALINNQPANNSDTPVISAPATLNPGEAFTATVSFRNISSQNAWTSGGTDPYRLGSQSPQDNITWGFNRAELPSSPVNVGQSVTFTLNCTAPATPANYAFSWRMVQEGVEWFGATASTTIAVGSPPADIIIDNPSATVVGTWSTGTSSVDKYGSDYRFKSAGNGTSYLQYTPNVATAGYYNVYEWHPAGGNRTTAAPFVINYNGGSQTVAINEQVNGGTWNLLGRYNFAAGTSGNVQITDNFPDTPNVVLADAIKLVWAP
jgi:N-acetyl-anhydromuramyl-L-alanine amidase AmpD